MSVAIDYQTEQELQREAMQAVHQRLGVTGLIRFIQQYDRGYGNYTQDRQQWQQQYDADGLFEAIKASN